MSRAFELFVFYFRLILMLVWMMISAVIAMPLALVRWKNSNNNVLFGKIYGPIARLIMGIRVEISGLENHSAHQPCIYVVNHQSGVDMTTMAQIYPPNTVLIGKKELRYIPFFGLMYEAFGNILINRQDRTNSVAGLNQAVAAIREKKVSIWIFPEGTRNKAGIGLLPFKKGAFHMAIAAQVPLVPIVCSNLLPCVNFEKKYARSGKVKVRILPPIFTKGRTSAELAQVLDETRQSMLQALEELNRQA